MPIEIKNVLVADAVDPSCVELLKSNGISVDYKLKLPENELIGEAKVKYVTRVETCQDPRDSPTGGGRRTKAFAELIRRSSSLSLRPN